MEYYQCIIIHSRQLQHGDIGMQFSYFRAVRTQYSIYYVGTVAMRNMKLLWRVALLQFTI